MSNPKVFEFAKEVGMTPLALMDKIREWHIPVKSHMAELDPEVLALIKVKLTGSSSSGDGEVKKAPAKKKAAPPAKAAPPEAPIKVGAKIVSKPASTPVSAPAPSAPKPQSTVVRRKAKTAEELKAEVASKESAIVAEESEHKDVLVATSAVTEEVKAPSQEAPPAKPVEATPAAPSAIITKPQITKPVTKAEAPAVSSIAVNSPAVASPVVSAGPVAAPVKSTPSTNSTSPSAVVSSSAAVVGAPSGSINKNSEDSHPEKKILARKKEVSIGNSGVESSVNVVIPPKRNIIGRMDLSRVQNPSPPRGPSGPRGPGGPQGSNSGPGGVGANRPRPGGGNIRAGFVQASPMPEQVVEDDSRKKVEDRRRNKGTPFEGPAVKPAVEGEVQTFDAAEFRKREMVFQPKKKKGMLSRPAMHTQITKPDASKRIVRVYGTMKVGDLAMEMKVKATDLTKVLMKNGVMGTINTDLDFETIALIAPEFQYEAQMAQKTADEVLVQVAFGDLQAEPIARPPVVTIMGHVDHGKTSLLDAIRNTSVTKGEAGGITQHIGAYQVKIESGQLITFLDTPGHEAFTQMRARGANVTDIAVIVVAADDGVMPQTAEAISHAKAAGVPLIVAVNKMDKPGANPDRVKQQLTEYQVVPEEWGGDTIFCPVSALKKTGVKELLEQILLVAEVEDLKANPKRSGTGAVIESRLEKGRGNVATILVHDGTVKIGQFIVAGTVSGRVKSMMTERGEKVLEAGPGMPVELLGLDGLPAAGDQFDIVKDERSAEQVAAIRMEKAVKANNPSSKMSLEELFSKVKSGDVKELPIILKADVAGSLEAISGMFTKLQAPEVKVKVIHAAVGGVTENDVLLASTAKGIVVGFNVRPDGGAASTAKRLGVDVRSYTIVYELMDEMKKAMAGLLQPDIVEKVMGRAEVRNTFSVPKIGTIGGCSVLDGKIQRSNMVRLVRDGKIVYDGKIGSLKRFKDDAKEVATGFECGIGIENFNDLKVGDIIEAYVKEEIAKELSLNATL